MMTNPTDQITLPFNGFKQIWDKDEARLLCEAGLLWYSNAWYYDLGPPELARPGDVGWVDEGFWVNRPEGDTYYIRVEGEHDDQRESDDATTTVS